MKHCIYFLCFIFLSGGLYAQENTKASDVGSRHFHTELNLVRANVSWSSFNMNEVNGLLASHGFRELKGGVPDYGIGITVVGKYSIVEGEIAYGQPQRVRDTTGLRYLTSEVSRASFSYGFNVVNKKQITVYPYVGVNFANIVLRHGTAADSASQWLSNGYQSARLTGYRVSVQPGLGFMYHIYSKKDESKPELTLYARAGYNIATQQNRWTVSGMKMAGPDWSPTLLLSFGLAVKISD